MKKFIYLLMAMIMLTGCAGNAENTENVETENLNIEEKFTDGDFAVYGENGISFTSLGMKKDTAESRLKDFDEYLDQIQVKYEDRIAFDEKGAAKTETVVKYISYDGPRIPIYTSKGIHTTGLYGKNDGCSTDDEVISAYGLDSANENYITDQRDENNYCISLYYDNANERIITPKDKELIGIDSYKNIRFLIQDGYVRDIDFYQVRWE